MIGSGCRPARAFVGAAVLAACAGAGCLDAGPTPVGRHLVARRTDSSVQFVAGAAGQPRRILLSRLENASGALEVTTQELSTVDDPGPGGGPATPRVLLDGVGSMFMSCASGRACTYLVDAQGRLYLDQETFVPSPDEPGVTDQSDVLVGVDPASGAQQRLGFAEEVLLSRDRARLFVEPLRAPLGEPAAAVGAPPPFVRELDGREIALPGSSGQVFAGDDLYFETDGGDLERLAAASEAPELVLADTAIFEVFETARGFLLIVGASPSGPGTAPTASLLDPSTLTETRLPAESAQVQTFAPSPSGRYVATATTLDRDGSVSPSSRLTIYDRDTGAQTLASAPAPIVDGLVWRPQHDEVWFLLNEGAGDHAWRWSPGGRRATQAEATRRFCRRPAPPSRRRSRRSRPTAAIAWSPTTSRRARTRSACSPPTTTRPRRFS